MTWGYGHSEFQSQAHLTGGRYRLPASAVCAAIANAWVAQGAQVSHAAADLTGSLRRLIVSPAREPEGRF